jgi:hypothetical protein
MSDANPDHDNELERWRSEWQELGGREGWERELSVRVVRDGRRIRHDTAVEIGATLVAILACVWFILRSHGEVVTTVTCASILVFRGIWVTRLLTLRSGTRQVDGTALDAFVEVTRLRLTDDLRWNTFVRRAIVGLMVIDVPYSCWAFVSHRAFYTAEPWRAIVGLAADKIILLALLVLQYRRRRALEAERERFESMVAERTLF